MCLINFSCCPCYHFQFFLHVDFLRKCNGSGINIVLNLTLCTFLTDMGNYQGNAVVNYTDYEVPYTRIIEHKHFEFGTQPKTVITREYPAAWEKGKEPYYPVNDPKNSELFDKYERRALEEKNVIFGGRLGMYRYMDMDQVIEEALSLAETELTYEEP